MTRSPAWARLLGATLPRNAAFDPDNKPYVGLHTPDIDGDPLDLEFATPIISRPSAPPTPAAQAPRAPPLPKIRPSPDQRAVTG